MDIIIGDLINFSRLLFSFLMAVYCYYWTIPLFLKFFANFFLFLLF